DLPTFVVVSDPPVILRDLQLFAANLRWPLLRDLDVDAVGRVVAVCIAADRVLALDFDGDDPLWGRPAGDRHGSPVPLDGFVDPTLYKVSEERQGVEEVALARGVAAHKDCQRLQRHVAERDALVAANPYPTKEWRLRWLVD